MRCIDSILKVSDQGVSRPFVCRDDDGGIRWCKGSHTGFNSNLLVNGEVYIIDHNNAFYSNFSVSRFLSEHILREFRDALSVMEREDFRRSVVELANGAFLDEVWGEMPEEWTDAAEESLPLPRIKAILQEGCDVGIA
jgi:hypothetical protein